MRKPHNSCLTLLVSASLTSPFRSRTWRAGQTVGVHAVRGCSSIACMSPGHERWKASARSSLNTWVRIWSRRCASRRRWCGDKGEVSGDGGETAQIVPLQSSRSGCRPLLLCGKAGVVAVAPALSPFRRSAPGRSKLAGLAERRFQECQRLRYGRIRDASASGPACRRFLCHCVRNPCPLSTSQLPSLSTGFETIRPC